MQCTYHMWKTMEMEVSVSFINPLRLDLIASMSGMLRNGGYKVIF